MTHMFARKGFNPPHRILIIRPSALGDVARSVPLLVSLRDAFPAAKIDWLVQDSFVDVVRAHPALTEAMPFPRAEFSRWLRAGRVDRLWSYLASLRSREYDIVIDAQGLARSGLIAWSTRAPRRIGHADARELGWLGYTERVPRVGVVHTVDQMLTLASAAGATARSDALAMRLYTPAEAAGFAAGRELVPSSYVVLAPTSRWIAKQWSDDRFAALAECLVAQGRTVVLVGGKSERAQIGACLALVEKHTGAGSPRAVDLVGGTSIAQLMNVIEHAALVVANDSAALHIAVGFSRPIVALFGPTRVERVGPYRREGDVLQVRRPGDTFDHKVEASRAMMERIGVEDVVAACEERLGR
jgi:lipopolysaccharide heptosyltransferase I